MERNEQIFFQKKTNPPVYMRNELRLRAIGWWILRDGLVWFGLVFYYIHTSFLDVLAWAQCDKRGCDVLLLPFLCF